MTNFTANQYQITDNQIEAFFGAIQGVHDLNLWNISLSPSGHGHYSITSTWNVNGSEIEIKTTTNNMQLVDAWKSGMQDLFEEGDDGYDNWNEVVESMLNAIDAEDAICESIEQ